jgi:hypothetical protein
LWRSCGARRGCARIGGARSGSAGIPEFAEKVADVVDLCLDPPGGAVVLSVGEKTQAQALGRDQPMLSFEFNAGEKRTHDCVRLDTTNLFG